MINFSFQVLIDKFNTNNITNKASIHSELYFPREQRGTILNGIEMWWKVTKIDHQRIILILTANFLFFIYLAISNER